MQLRPIKHQKYFKIARKVKITQCSKSWSKRKQVAQNTKSYQKVAEQLMESPTGAHPDGHQRGERKPTETLATEFCYQGVILSLEELKNGLK